MKILKRILIILSALFILASIYFIFIKSIVDINVSETFTNTTIDSKIPFKKTVPFKVPFVKERNADIIIKDIHVSFLSYDDRPQDNGFIQVTGTIYGDIEGTKVLGDFDLFGQIEYDNPSFYIRDIQFNSVNIQELSLSDKDQATLDKGKAKVEKAKAIKNKLTSWFKNKNNTPKDDAFNKAVESKINAYSLKIKEWFAEKSKTIIKDKISQIPVYTLKQTDYKQSLLKMAIDNVFISNGNILIQMDIGKLFKTFYLYIFMFFSAIALVFGLLLNGERGSRKGGGGIDLDIGDMFSGIDF
jgi:preprotein translocase subunit SecG